MSSKKAKSYAVSVIIPAYNHEGYIAETVESALAQDVDLEIIVIDDGSKDNTWGVLQQYKKADNIRLYHQENTGTAQTLNRGLRLAKGGVISILNSDDAYHADRLKTVLEKAPKKKPFWAYTGVQLIDGQSAPITSGPAFDWHQQALGFYQDNKNLAVSLLKNNFICTTSNLVFSQSLVKKTGGFRPLLYINDLDFIFRAMAVCPPVCLEDQLMDYRVHQENTIARAGQQRAGFIFEFAWMLSQVLLRPETERLFDGNLLESIFEFYPESCLAIMETMKRFHRTSLKKRDALLADNKVRKKCTGLIELQLKDQERSKPNRDELDSLKARNEQLSGQVNFLKSELEESKRFAGKKAREAERVWRERRGLLDELNDIRNSRGYKAAQFFADMVRFRNPRQSGMNLAKAMVPEKYVPMAKRIYHRNFNNLELLDRAGFLAKKIKHKILPKKKYTQAPYSGPLLSVIITCYNYGQYLDRVLESLDRQTWPYFQAILIDDGSTDSFTRQKIKEIESRDIDYLTVILQENQGVVAARNTAIQKASGKYIFPLDADDRIEPDFVEKCLLYLETCPDNTFVYPWTYSLGEECFIWRTKDSLPDEILVENKMGFAVFPRAAWEKCHGYSPEMKHGYEDWEFCVKMVANGYVGRAIPEPLYLYEVKDQSRNMDALKKHDRLAGLIAERHGDEIKGRAKSINHMLKEQWVVENAFVNMARHKREQAFFMDLTAGGSPMAETFSALMSLAAAGGKKVVVVCPAKHRKFFTLCTHPDLIAFYPESATPGADRAELDRYLDLRYELEPVTDAILGVVPANTKDEAEAETEKTTILYVAPWLITGGADQMTVDWFRALPDGEFDKIIFFTENKRDEWEHKLKGHVREVYDLPDLGLDTLDKITDFMVHFIKSRGVDIVHIMNSMAGYQSLSRIKSKVPGVKIVAQMHCYDFLEDGTRTGYPDFVPEKYDGQIDCYNVVSDCLANEMIKSNPHLDKDKFKTIYCCVDSEKYDPGQSRKDRDDACFHILFIGRLDKQKQPLRMARTALELKNRGLDFKVHVIGGGSLNSLESELKDFVREHRLDSHLILHGFQPRQAVKDWYAKGHCLLMTSDWEGIPVVVYEAMSMGLTCVVPDVGGISELVTPDTGILIPDREDITAYADAVCRLYENRKAGETMGAKARERIVAEFDLSRIENDYRELYSNLIKRKS